MEQHVNFYFRSILCIFIHVFHSTFLEVEKQGYFSGFSTSPGHVIYLHLLKTVRSVRAPPPFVFVALQLGGKSNGMDYFGLWEGLPSPWWGHGKQPQFSLLDITQIYLTDCFWFNYGLSWWTNMSIFFLFPVNFRYIHILGRSNSMEILSVLVHLQITWSASHTPPAQNCEKCESSSSLFHLSSRTLTISW